MKKRFLAVCLLMALLCGCSGPAAEIPAARNPAEPLADQESLPAAQTGAVPETQTLPCDHVWEEGTCQTVGHCTLCGLEDGPLAAHAVAPKTLTGGGVFMEEGMEYPITKEMLLTGTCTLCGEEIQTDYANREFPADIILGKWTAHSYLGYPEGMQEAPADMAWVEFRVDGTASHCVNGTLIEGTWNFGGLSYVVGPVGEDMPVTPRSSKFTGKAPVVQYDFKYIVMELNEKGEYVPVEYIIEVWFCGEDMTVLHFMDKADGAMYELFAAKE